MRFLLPAIIAIALGVVAVIIIDIDIGPVFTAIRDQITGLGKLVDSVLP